MTQLYVTNPFDDSPVGEVKLCSESEVEAAFAAHSVKANVWVSDQIGAVIYGPVVNGAPGSIGVLFSF